MKVDSEVKTQLTSTTLDAIEQVAQGKKFWRSKTFWVNFVMVFAAIVQLNWGVVIDSNMQMIVVALVNLWLRHHTSEPIEWK